MLRDEEFFEFYDWYKSNSTPSLVFFQGQEKEENSINDQLEKIRLELKYKMWKHKKESESAKAADPEVVINFNSKVK